MECEYQIKGTTLRIFLPQELDHHVSARLREEADADEAFAKELCSKLGLSFYREEADVKALAKAEG